MKLNEVNKMEKKQQQKENIIKIIDGISSTLNFTAEDKKTIRFMIDAYYRKRIGITESGDEITAAAFLWQYSKMNFLWEHDKSCKQQNISQLLDVRPKTVSNKSSEISKALKIDFFDERFCRKEISDKNPRKAYDLTKKHFNNQWPLSIEWGIIENRQYLRAMHGLGIIYWRERKVI